MLFLIGDVDEEDWRRIPWATTLIRDLRLMKGKKGPGKYEGNLVDADNKDKIYRISRENKGLLRYLVDKELVVEGNIERKGRKTIDV